MPGVLLWGYDKVSGEWKPYLVDADGHPQVDVLSQPDVAQTDPTKLKHIPHGYYAAGPSYLPFKVSADGTLQTSGVVSGNLDDLADVNVPTPTDQYLLYWDATAGKWQCKALVDADIPATICRDSELSDHAALPDVHHTTHLKTLADHPLSIIPTMDDAHIPATIARDAEVATAVSDHAAIAAAHHTKTVDASELTAGELPTARLSANIKTLTITFIIDGGGSAITTGQKGHLEIPFACTLTAWTLMANVAGAIVIDIWKDTYANFPPTNADAMPGAGKEPTIATTNQRAQDTDISDWTTVAIAAGDILAFNVDSCTTITRVTLSLQATKT